VKDLEKYSSIILCSGVYGDKIHKDLLRWIENIEKSSLNEQAKMYMFLTWFGRGDSEKNAIENAKDILEKKSIRLEDDYITCFGGKGFVRKNHPNTEDCENILDWVKSKS